MKILIAVPDTCVGGVTTSAANFACELVRRGHSVCFLDMSGEFLCDDRLEKGIEKLSLKGRSKLWNISSKSVKSARGIKKIAILAFGIIKKLTIRSGLWYNLVFSKQKDFGEFDVAIAFRQCAPCYSFVLNKINAKKKLGFVHGEPAYMGDISSWKKYMTKFDKIAYVSNAVKNQFIEKYPELEKNACTIYNMFDVNRIKALANEDCDIVFDKDKVNIVTVARIDNAFKQIDWIVKVCEKLKKQPNKAFHWYVVGDGPDFDETMKLSKELEVDDVLSFLGNKNNPYPYIHQSDFTVLTSKSESYGMVVVESFILKKPVVAALYPALNEMMKDGNQGLVAKQNIESIAENVSKMIENTSNIRSLCEKTLSKVEINNDVAYNQFLKLLTG